jgi:hypothetical protein
MNLNLDKIKIDGGTQSRAKIDQDVVAEYADLIKSGTIFPPVTVFYDGVDYILADGFHRYFANRKAGTPNVEVQLHEGTLRDAILYSFSANHSHGLRRTSADKRKAVTAMLEDIEWQDWSDREIAKHCRVSSMLVGTIRKDLGATKKETKFMRNGKEVTQTEKPKKKDDPVETFNQEEINAEIQKAATDSLQKENEDLKDQLTVALAASTDDAEKEIAESIIKDLRSQIRMLEVELKAMTDSRDQFQSENIQLMKQVAMLQKKLKKIEDK